MGTTFLKKGFAPMSKNSFLYDMTPVYMGGNNENDRVASPESRAIHLKRLFFFFFFFCYFLRSPSWCTVKYLN